MPLKKNGWQFNWKSLAKVKEGLLFKIVLQTENEEQQGMLLLTLQNEEMIYMNNVEVAPQNYGSGGKYDRVAGCLIAFASLKSFELGKGHYQGFLVFESKTALLELYEKKYGASIAMGQRMFIDDKAAKPLIKKYLDIEI